MFGGQLYRRAVRGTAHYMDRRPGILIIGRGSRSNAAQEQHMTLQIALPYTCGAYFCRIA